MKIVVTEFMQCFRLSQDGHQDMVVLKPDYTISVAELQLKVLQTSRPVARPSDNLLYWSGILEKDYLQLTVNDHIQMLQILMLDDDYVRWQDPRVKRDLFAAIVYFIDKGEAIAETQLRELSFQCLRGQVADRIWPRARRRLSETCAPGT